MSNLYLTKRQKAFAQAAFEHLSDEVREMFEDAEELAAILVGKVTKKKIDKTATFEPLLVTDIKGRILRVVPREGNGAMRFQAVKESFPASFNGYFSYEWDIKNLCKLINYLHEYVVFTGHEEYDVHQVAYSDEFNVYTREDETERTINISGSDLYFVCYTDDVQNDDWTFLTPARTKEALRSMVACVFLHSDREEVFGNLHLDIQEKYLVWLQNQVTATT